MRSHRNLQWGWDAFHLYAPPLLLAILHIVRRVLFWLVGCRCTRSTRTTITLCSSCSRPMSSFMALALAAVYWENTHMPVVEAAESVVGRRGLQQASELSLSASSYTVRCSGAVCGFSQHDAKYWQFVSVCEVLGRFWSLLADVLCCAHCTHKCRIRSLILQFVQWRKFIALMGLTTR